MKILIVTPYVPYPPHSGGRLRIWEEIKFLGRRHDLTLVSFHQLDREHRSRDVLAEHCRRVYLVRRPQRPSEPDLTALETVSDLFAWYTTPEMSRVLRALGNDTFDVVLLHHVFTAQYREWFRAPAVLEEHNIESELFRQQALTGAPAGRERTFREARWLLLRNYEDDVWRRFPLRVVVSEPDRQRMDHRCAVGRTLVVENGLDVGEIEMLPDPTSRTLLFMGSLDFYPNIDALSYLQRSILPVLWSKDPSIRLVVAGRRPPDAIRALARDARITVIADPDEMTPIVRQCAQVIVPMRMGSGTRLKILHAMALGRPVVTTRRGCEGLAVTDESELLIRDDPEGFADAVLRVLDDRTLAERLRVAGRRLVEMRYDCRPKLEKLEEALEMLANGQALQTARRAFR